MAAKATIIGKSYQTPGVLVRHHLSCQALTACCWPAAPYPGSNKEKKKTTILIPPRRQRSPAQWGRMDTFDFVRRNLLAGGGKKRLSRANRFTVGMHLMNWSHINQIKSDLADPGGRNNLHSDEPANKQQLTVLFFPLCFCLFLFSSPCPFPVELTIACLAPCKSPLWINCSTSSF